MKVAINLGRSVLVFLVLLAMPMVYADSCNSAYYSGSCGDFSDETTCNSYFHYNAGFFYNCYWLGGMSCEEAGSYCIPTIETPSYSASNLTNGLVAYYPFENNYTDMSGNGNDGSVVGNVSFETGYNSTTGIHINNATSALDIGNASMLQLTNNFTISAWVYLGNTPTYQPDYYFFFSKGYDGEFDIYYAPSVSEIRTVRKAQTASVSGTISTEGWNFITFRAVNGEVDYYENGTFVSIVGWNFETINPTATNVVLGNRGDDGSDDSVYGSNMTMDNVGIWNRALSDEEISLLYNGSSPLPEEPIVNTAPSVTLSVYWDRYNNMICEANATDDFNTTIAVDTCWKSYLAGSCLASGNTTYYLSNGTSTIVGNYTQPFSYTTKRKCVAVAYDGELASGTVNSATIGEWQPHLKSVTASQNVSGDGNIECYGESYGVVSPSVVYESRWYKESIYQAGYENSLNVTDTASYLVGIVPYANLTNGDNWTCEIRTDNGEHYAPYINSSVVTAVVTTTTTTIAPTPTGEIVERNISAVLTLLVVFMVAGVAFLIKQYFVQ